MTVIARIKDQIENNSVVLYMKGTPDFPQCGFSGQSVQILNACQAKFMYVNIFEDAELREALKEYSNWPTYPQLYINGELVGGCDIIIDLYKKGELLTMLTAVGVVEA
ncbi:Grx4 family monothiol glutaredoxin [Methylobacter psychrophilus]|uniref:Grx4 family monothiol glutaredoxin n=1 Tax=Methylobacter psychrophilus TaxID=96941 RepID=UPI002948C47B|nr:Grx4 family monothiol glutaredoxin [Methylobacter psychrophilus]